MAEVNCSCEMCQKDMQEHQAYKKHHEEVVRNDLAKTAMQALLSTGNYSCQGSGSGSLIYNCQEIARCCYNLADAMMAGATKQ